MKNIIIILLLVVLCSTGFSKVKQGYEYNGRFTPTITTEKLNAARFINEIMPEFCRHFALPAKEYAKFNQLITLENSPQGNFSYTNEYFHQQENYEKIIDIISVEVISNCNGKSISAQSKKNVLTAEQKTILSNADFGTDINVKIKFKYKYATAEFPENDTKIYEGRYSVTVVPYIEAEYPGGFKAITNYITKTVFNKLPGALAFEKINNAAVKFTITEEGQITTAKMARTSGDINADKLILDAIHKMPKWKPAQNAKGENVNQEFIIPFGGNGC